MSALLRFLLVFMLLGLAASSVPAQPIAAPQPEAGEAVDESDETDDFVYEVVARTNEGVVSNIDTAELALLAVLAAIAAVVVFGIDKIRELAPPWELLAYLLLGGSGGACVVGYLIGLFKAREPIDPRSFLVDFADDPEETRTNATLGTVRAYYQNARDRFAKRIAVTAALALLVVGTVVIALARSSGGMVQCA